MRIKEDIAQCLIISINGKVLPVPYEAAIRKQNVRLSEVF